MRELRNAVARRLALGELADTMDEEDGRVRSRNRRGDPFERIFAMGLPFHQARQRLSREFRTPLRSSCARAARGATWARLWRPLESQGATSTCCERGTGSREVAPNRLLVSSNDRSIMEATKDRTAPIRLHGFGDACRPAARDGAPLPFALESFLDAYRLAALLMGMFRCGAAGQQGRLALG